MSDTPFVHVPYSRLEASLPFLLENRLPPEVAFKGPDLDLLDFGQLRRLGRELSTGNLPVTVHAPFLDLNPGSLDPLVFQVTSQRFTQTLDAAETLRARVAIFHPGFDRWRYGTQETLWLDQNLRFWPPLLRRAAGQGCVMTLENIFEETPDLLLQLLRAVDSPFLRHCFDIGHWNLFSRLSSTDWIRAMGSHTVHVHLHDNHGLRDEHLAVGDGEIDFACFFEALQSLESRPSFTLEGHDHPTLLRSLACVSPFLSS